jgi:hypothetical protein
MAQMQGNPTGTAVDFQIRALKEYSPENADYLRTMLAVLFHERRHADAFHHLLEKTILIILIFRRQDQLAKILL